jgi:hypothetical protein
MPRARYEPKNPYWLNSNLSQREFLRVLASYCAGESATTAHDQVRTVSRETVGRYYRAFGERLIHLSNRFTWRVTPEDLYGSLELKSDIKRSPERNAPDPIKQQEALRRFLYEDELVVLSRTYGFVLTEVRDWMVRVLQCSAQMNGLKGRSALRIMNREIIKWIIEAKVGIRDPAATLNELMKQHYILRPGPYEGPIWGRCESEHGILGDAYHAHLNSRAEHAAKLNIKEVDFDWSAVGGAMAKDRPGES